MITKTTLLFALLLLTSCEMSATELRAANDKCTDAHMMPVWVGRNIECKEITP
jgi:hypothetical protein